MGQALIIAILMDSAITKWDHSAAGANQDSLEMERIAQVICIRNLTIVLQSCFLFQGRFATF